jgi:hypothetical protein
MATNLCTYYYKQYTRVQAEVEQENEENLRQLFENTLTFVYFPLRVRHDAYENERIRKACGVFKANKVQRVLDLPLASFRRRIGTYSVLGRMTVTLRSRRSQNKEKRLSLFYSRSSTTVTSVAQGLMDLETVRIDGEDWEIIRVTGAAERVILKKKNAGNVENAVRVERDQSPNFMDM